MGSKRLPGKVMKKLGDSPVLQHVINRTLAAMRLDSAIVATSTEKQDDVISSYCFDRGISCFRGHESDVLSRYLDAAKKVSAKIIVRITADCPLISPEIIDAVIDLREEKNSDYASNTLNRTFPHGLDVECFTYQALERSARAATLDYDREHVTPYIYNNPSKFTLAVLASDEDFSNMRVTLDMPADYALIEKLFSVEPLLVNPSFGWRKTIELIKSTLELKRLHAAAKHAAIS
jgi:spore coat polysaccharide biosynthesis protein SpsF